MTALESAEHCVMAAELRNVPDGQRWLFDLGGAWTFQEDA